MEPDREEPRELHPRRRRLLKVLAIVVAVPSVLLFAGVSFFVARTVYMHDEERCPFERVEVRDVAAGIDVLEEKRVCQEGVEEHRWLVVREDGARREVGRRRLLQPAYEDYRWTATLEDGQVHIEVENEGVEAAHWREEPPSDRN